MMDAGALSMTDDEPWRAAPAQRPCLDASDDAPAGTPTALEALRQVSMALEAGGAGTWLECHHFIREVVVPNLDAACVNEMVALLAQRHEMLHQALWQLAFEAPSTEAQWRAFPRSATGAQLGPAARLHFRRAVEALRNG